MHGIPVVFLLSELLEKDDVQVATLHVGVLTFFFHCLLIDFLFSIQVLLKNCQKLHACQVCVVFDSCCHYFHSSDFIFLCWCWRLYNNCIYLSSLKQRGNKYFNIYIYIYNSSVYSCNCCKGLNIAYKYTLCLISDILADFRKWFFMV